MPSLLRQNLELKARCADLAATRDRLQPFAPRPGGLEVQTDTFFRVSSGRLKLREIDGQEAVLIWYDRPDTSSTRTSAYHLVPVPDTELMRTVLASALGVRGQVRKRREIHFWHNVRIHLDQVDGLGTFLEFEAVLTPGEDPAVSQERLDQLSLALGILPGDLEAMAYADLLGL